MLSAISHSLFAPLPKNHVDDLCIQCRTIKLAIGLLFQWSQCYAIAVGLAMGTWISTSLITTGGMNLLDLQVYLPPVNEK